MNAGILKVLIEVLSSEKVEGAIEFGNFYFGRPNYVMSCHVMSCDVHV